MARKIRAQFEKMARIILKKLRIICRFSAHNFTIHSLCRTDGRYPDDMSLNTRQAGKPAVWNATVICTTAPSLFGLIIPRGRRCSRNGGVTQDGQIVTGSSILFFHQRSSLVAHCVRTLTSCYVIWETSVGVFRRRPWSSVFFGISWFQLSCSLLTLCCCTTVFFTWRPWILDIGPAGVASTPIFFPVFIICF